MFIVEIRHCIKLSADICCSAGRKEELTKPSSRRPVTVAQFLADLTSLMQKFPNGVPVSKLAAEYKVYM